MRFFHICNIWSGETVAKVTKAKIQTPDWEHGCAITQNLQLCETEIIMHNKLKIQLNLWPLQWGHLVTLFSCLHAGMVWETHISTVLSDCLHPMIKHHKFQGAHFPHPSQSPNDFDIYEDILGHSQSPICSSLEHLEFRATCYMGFPPPSPKHQMRGKWSSIPAVDVEPLKLFGGTHSRSYVIKLMHV